MPMTTEYAAREPTRAEIDALLADAHAALPRWEAKKLGAIYARYSTEFQDSIAPSHRVYVTSISHGITLALCTRMGFLHLHGLMSR